MTLGKEVVQMYLGMENYASEGRPMKDLRAFDKVDLAPGESKDVTFTIKLSDLQYFDDRQPADKVFTGTYTGYTHVSNPAYQANASNVVYGVDGSGWKVTPGSVFNVIIGDTSDNFVLAEEGVTDLFLVTTLDTDFSADTLAEAAGGTLSAKVSLAPEADADYIVIAALYDNGTLRGIASKGIAVEAGGYKTVTVDIAISEETDNLYYKLFIWDSKTYKPVIAAFFEK